MKGRGPESCLKQFLAGTHFLLLSDPKGLQMNPMNHIDCEHQAGLGAVRVGVGVRVGDEHGMDEFTWPIGPWPPESPSIYYIECPLPLLY